MSSPLIVRPGYGEGHPALPTGKDPTAVARLPEGDPAGKGIGMDPKLKGEKTYQKPESDIRHDDSDAKDESIYRKDDAGSLLKRHPQVDVRDDNADSDISNNGLGKYDYSDGGKTPYPYRDGVPNRGSSLGDWVLNLWNLRSAHQLIVSPSTEVRIAARMGDMLNGLNPKVDQRAKHCSVSLKRADIPNLRWIFSVDCGNGSKAVRMDAQRIGNTVKLSKMDLHMSCSCHAWRWLGSEHHAVKGDYIDGNPRGTATVPAIKDPQMHNRVCKHVAAVLGTSRGWEIPQKGK